MRRIVFFLLLCVAFCSFGQSGTQSKKLDREFLNFFLGDWSGDGEFANGKKISADAVFKLTLDSSWLSYEHTDKQPNRYKALSMWGVDGNGQFVAYAFDNFKGHREFVTNGWKDGKLILSTNEFYPMRGIFFQRFIYEKISNQSFKMTYETSSDGIRWNLGDYLTFTKK